MPKKFSTFSSLKFKDFRLFFWGSLISQIGTQMQVVGVNWQIYELTRSPISLGLVGASDMVSINMIFFQGGPQLGETEAGFLAALTGAPTSVVIGGIATLLTTALLTILTPKLKDYSGHQLKL